MLPDAEPPVRIGVIRSCDVLARRRGAWSLAQRLCSLKSEVRSRVWAWCRCQRYLGVSGPDPGRLHDPAEDLDPFWGGACPDQIIGQDRAQLRALGCQVHGLSLIRHGL